MWTRLSGHGTPRGADAITLVSLESPSVKIMETLIKDYADILTAEDKSNDIATLGILSKRMNGKPSYKVKYQRKVYNGVRLGRFWPDGGMFALSNKVLATVIGHTHVEVDLSNFNPTIALQLFPELELPTLSDYVRDRDDFVSSIKRDLPFVENPKKLMLRIMTTGSNWKRDAVWGQQFTDIQREEVRRHNRINDFASDCVLIHRGVELNYHGLVGIPNATTVSSSLTFLLQDIESCIVEIARRCVEERMPGAFAIYRCDGYIVPVEIAEQLVGDVKMKTKDQLGFDVELKIKQLAPSYQLCFTDEEMDNDGRYLRWKTDFEKTWFYVNGLNRYARISPIDGTISLSSENEFRQATRTEVPDFIEQWTKDPQHRAYEKMDNIPPPLECPDSVFNRFNGLAVERYEPVDDALVDGIVEPVLVVIDVLTGGGRGECFNWVLDWIALAVKEPGNNPKIVPCFVSSEGVGKDTIFTDLLGDKIIGKEYSITIPSVASLFCQNGALQYAVANKVLVVINEAKKSDNFQQQERMRNLITNDKHNVKMLYSNEYIGTISMSIVMFSNRFNSMPTGRRYVAFNAQPANLYPVNFWTDFHEQLATERLPRAFYQFLLRRDVSVRSLLMSRPTTSLDQDLAGSNGGYFEIWIKDLLESETRPWYVDSMTSMRDSFNTFVSARNMCGLTCTNNPQFKLLALEFDGKISAGYTPKVTNGPGPSVTMTSAIRMSKTANKDVVRFDVKWIRDYFKESVVVDEVESDSNYARGFVVGN